MLRRWIIALFAVAAIGATLAPSDVSARGRGGHGGGFHGGGFHGGGFRGGFGFGPRFYGGGYYPYYGAYGYPYGAYGCYRTVRVATPYGIRLRRMWVCG